MATDSLIITSATGVDVELAIAGPGSRSHAFIIDWHIRLLLAVTWFALAAYAQTGVFYLRGKSAGAVAALSLLPAFAIYFLYHPVVELAMRGRTPGKRMAGVRILNRNGGSPSMTALSIRNIFRLIDCLPVLYVVGLVTCFFTANRVRIGDMAAGTLLVLDDAAAEKSLVRIESLAVGSRLPLDALELVDQILERWESLDKNSRARIARSLLGRINATNQPAELASLNDAELHARLRALLSDRDETAGHV